MTLPAVLECLQCGLRFHPGRVEDWPHKCPACGQWRCMFTRAAWYGRSPESIAAEERAALSSLSDEQVMERLDAGLEALRRADGLIVRRRTCTPPQED